MSQDNRTYGDKFISGNAAFLIILIRSETELVVPKDQQEPQ